jgi:hypothetical protein
MIQRTPLLLAAFLALAACAEDTYVFEDVDTGGDGSGRAPRERTNSQFVRAVYADLIGRTPETYDFVVSVDGTEALRFPLDEEELLLNALDGVGDAQVMRSILVAGLLDSVEIELPAKAEVDDPDEWIAEQFRFFLGREPGVYELRAFAAEWAADAAVNPRTVIRALLESREYQSY